MNKPISSSDARWRALMLRAIASKCSKGMADVTDAEVLTRIADYLEANEKPILAT